MKKIITLILLLVALISISACKKENTTQTTSVTFNDMYTNAVEKIETSQIITIQQDFILKYQLQGMSQSTQNKIKIELQKDPAVVKTTMDLGLLGQSVSYLTNEDGNYYSYLSVEDKYLKSLLDEPQKMSLSVSDLIGTIDEKNVVKGTEYKENNTSFLDFSYEVPYKNLNSEFIGTFIDAFLLFSDDSVDEEKLQVTLKFNVNTNELVMISVDMKHLMSTILNSLGTTQVEEATINISFSYPTSSIDMSFKDLVITEPGTEDEDEPDAIHDDLTEVILNEVTTGHHIDILDYDMFKFTITEEGIYKFYVQNTDKKMTYFEIYNEEGTLINQNRDFYTINKLTPGHYYLKVQIEMEDDSFYEIHFEREYETRSEMIDIILDSPNKQYDEQSDYNGDLDSYRLTITEPTYLDIKTENHPWGGVSLIITNEQRTFKYDSYTSHVTTLLVPGVYIIQAKTAIVRSDDRDFNFTITKYDHIIDDYPSIYLGDESAGLLDLNVKKTISIDTNQDKDLYVMTILESGQYAFKYPISQHITIEVVDENGNLTNAYNWSEMLLNPGKYYVYFSGQTQDIEVELVKNQADDYTETNLGSISLNSTTNGRFNYRYDHDYFELTIQNEGFYDLSISNDIKLEIYDSQNRILYPVLSGENLADTIYLQPGNYTVKIIQNASEWYFEEYQFMIKASETTYNLDDYPNNLFLTNVTYQTFTSADVINGTLDYQKDHDVFIISTKQMERYVFEMTPGVKLVYYVKNINNFIKINPYINQYSSDSFILVVSRDESVNTSEVLSYTISYKKY